MGRVSKTVMFVGVFTFLGGLAQGLPLSATLGEVMMAQHPIQAFYRGYRDGRGSEG